MSFAWLYIYLLPFLVVLTVVVFVHELGHYLMARRNGVKIEVFSIGFGPEFFGFNDRTGTRWKFSIIPLGGYVKMFSDADASSRPDTQAVLEMTDEEKAVSHYHKNVWQKIQIAAGGPLSNYLFGILLLFVVYSFHGQRVMSNEPVIGFLLEGGVAEQSGLKVGDRIVSVDNNAIASFQDLVVFIRQHAAVGMEVVVERDGERLTKTLIPQQIEIENADGKPLKTKQIGIGSSFELVQRGFFEALLYAVYDAYAFTVNTLTSLAGMVLNQNADGLSGPIGIAKQTGEIATSNVPTFLWFMAILSINLGFINLLPIPVLDGGHLLFYFIEAIRGKPLSEKAQERAFLAGLGFILTLVVFTTYKDLEKINIVSKIISLFN